MMKQMGAASQLMSLAEYLTFETPAGTKDELIEGELIISPSGSPITLLSSKGWFVF